MGGGEWMTTKKRGRDDDQIAHDREKAKETRKLQKSRGKPGKKKVAAVTAKKPKRGGQRKGRKMDSLVAEDDDSFVVDDDESVGEWNGGSSEDELDVLPDEASDDSLDGRARKGTKKKTAAGGGGDDDSDDSETFFPLYQKRSSKPSAALHKARKKPVAAKKGQRKSVTAELSEASSSDDSVDTMAKKSAARTKKPEVVNLLAADSSSDGSEYNSKSALKPAAKKKPARRTSVTAALSPLSEVDSPLPLSSGLAKSAVTLPARADSLASKAGDDSFDDEDTTMVALPNKLVSKIASHSRRVNDKLMMDCLEDTPLASSAIRKKPKKKKRQIVDSDDDNTNKAILHADYCSDEDEAVALAHALEQSKKEEAQRVSADNSAGGSPEEQELQDSSEDEQGDEQDGYVDETEQEASSILDTANELSAQVLRTMSKWTKGAVDGMIVDGALALFKTGSDDTLADTDHTWISLETMKEILPTVTLADYQLIGVNWIALLHGMKCEVEGTKNRHTPVNGILADEMGLGKTCQTIAFLAWLKHTEGSDAMPLDAVGTSMDDAVELGDSDDSVVEVPAKKSTSTQPHLVIAPASVISNWEREFEKFAPQLKVVKYHGTMNERLEIQDDLRQFLPGGRRQPGRALDVILAPITYFQKEKSDDRGFLKKFKYSYLIVDEAHLLKNAQGLRYKNLDRFSTVHRLLLTGTPVQNNPKELLALLCFLMPLFSRKGSDDFDDSSSKNDGGEEMLKHFVSLQDGQDDQAAYRKLKQLFSPFVLRRRKMDVLSQIMMPKIQKVIKLEIDKKARDRYNKVIADNLAAKKNKTASINDHLFTQLRKAAHHPLMLRSRYTSKTEREHLAKWFYQYGAFRGEACTKHKVGEELDKYSDFEIHLTASELCDEHPLRRNEIGRYILDEQDLFCSAKFVKLQELLPKLIEEGHRILIFSVWTSCLDLLGCLLQQMKLKNLRMDGSTAVSERQSMIDEFNNDASIPVFLLSTKACGLGINLTAADTVIMHDLDFNPFADLQAEDRCHRIGQKKTVTIIKLVSQDTVDEDIYAMQQRKAKMNAAIMDNDWAQKEKKVVMKAAVERYLKSPTAGGRSSSSSSSTLDEKENTKNEGSTEESM